MFRLPLLTSLAGYFDLRKDSGKSVVILERNREALGTLLHQEDRHGFDAKRSTLAMLTL